MALNKLTPNAPAFESEDFDADEAITQVTEITTHTTTSTAPTTMTTTTAIAPVSRSTNQVGFSSARDVIGEMKDKIVVSYNTLESIIASNGNFLLRKNKQVLGDTICFDLESFQDSYVVQSGDDRADKSTVRYSDDGLVCSDGTLVTEHLSELRAMGYSKASIKQRMVVVGSIISTSKPANLEDEMVQFDLSPKSRDMFVRYKIKAANAILRGKATEAQVVKVRATTELSSSGSNTFTLVCFSVM